MWLLYFQGSLKVLVQLRAPCGFMLQMIIEVACGEWTGKPNICRKSENHQGKRLKGKSIWGERSTSLLLLVCQNVFNGFIGYFSHLRNWHEKGLGCNKFLSLSYKIAIFFSFENFTSDLHIAFMPWGLTLQQNYIDKTIIFSVFRSVITATLIYQSVI